jgi:lysophospholipase L1-like esterase
MSGGLRSKGQRHLSLPRTIGFALLTAALCLGAAEAGLRLLGAGQLAASRSPAAGSAAVVSPGPEQPPPGRVLWATGDSNTFGVGAEHPASESYPVVAARLLSEAGVPTTAYNFAIPGSASDQAVDSLLAEVGERPDPDYIVAMVGMHNVGWTSNFGETCTPVAVHAERPGRAPPWLRSLRLYKLLRNSIAYLQRGQERAGGELCALMARAFDGVHLSGTSQQLAEPIEQFQRAQSLAPSSPWPRFGLAMAQLRAGRYSLAESLLADLAESRLEVDPGTLSVLHAFALRAMGQPGAARARLADSVSHPKVQFYKQLLGAWLSYDAGDAAAALAAFQALETARPAQWKAARFEVRDGQAWSLLALGRLAEARALLEDSLRDRQDYGTIDVGGWCRVGLALISALEEQREAALEQLEQPEIDAQSRAGALAVSGWLEAAPPGGEASPSPVLQPTLWIEPHLWFDRTNTAMLAADLARLQVLTDGVGARLYLATYPFANFKRAEHELIRDFAAAGDAVLVDLQAAFAEVTAERGNYHHLLAADGHPNTAGYALLGQVLADAIRRDRGLRK